MTEEKAVPANEEIHRPLMDGDLLDAEGEHIGEIYLEDLPALDKIKHGYKIQVYLGGNWYVYQLISIEKAEEANGKTS